MNAPEVHRDVGKSLLLSAPASDSIESEQRERDKYNITIQQNTQDNRQVVMTALRVPRVSQLLKPSYSLFIIYSSRKHENILQKVVFSGKIFTLQI